MCAFLLSASAALADDGVIEINQARAEAGGVSVGDAAGFPVKILEPGSYRLTSDLVLPETNQDAIRIETTNVTLDLNGFSIIGPFRCEGDPVVCTGSATGYGIRTLDQGSGPLVNSDGMVKIRNGKIRGVGGRGVSCSEECFVEDLEIKESGQDGLNVGSGYVRRVNSHRNGGMGIFSQRSMISDCQAASNAGAGIRSTNGHIRDSFAFRNGDDGLVSTSGSVTGSVSRENAAAGLDCNSCTYGDNVLTGNDTDVTGTNRSQLGDNICGSSPCP